MLTRQSAIWFAAVALLNAAANRVGAESLASVVDRPAPIIDSNLAPILESAAPIIGGTGPKRLAPIQPRNFPTFEPLGTVSLASAHVVDNNDFCLDAVDSGCPPKTCDGWFATFDYLTWKPRQRGMDFAVAENGSALTVGRGRMHNLELDRDNGARISLGYQTKSGWSIGAKYTYFDTDGTATVTRPPGIGELFATRSHPDTNEEANIATALGDFDYRVFDVEAGHGVYQSDFAEIRVFGGVRFSEIAQRLRIDYDGRDFVEGLVQSGMSMESFGFQIGSEGHWRMAKGFGLFARTSTGLALGRFETELFESNLGGIQVIADARDTYDQAVPTLEISGGLSWQRGGFEIAAGYEMLNLFNVSNRAAFIDDIHEGLYGPFENDVLLEGLFARVSFAH